MKPTDSSQNKMFDLGMKVYDVLDELSFEKGLSLAPRIMTIEDTTSVVANIRERKDGQTLEHAVKIELTARNDKQKTQDIIIGVATFYDDGEEVYNYTITNKNYPVVGRQFIKALKNTFKPLLTL